MKKLLDRIFIDGLGGMAQGLFATLIIGTIIQQIGLFMGGGTGDLIYELGKIAAGLTGAGIGVGVARKLEAGHLVIVSAAVVGMIGAFAGKILSGQVLVDGNLVLAGPGEPLGAFAAAYLAIEIGILISGKTKLDIILTPLVCIGTGSAVGLFVGPPISEFMLWLGSLINWGTEQQPFLMGIVVSVLMGMILTLPISSAALGVILNLSVYLPASYLLLSISNYIIFYAYQVNLYIYSDNVHLVPAILLAGELCLYHHVSLKSYPTSKGTQHDIVSISCNP